MSAPSKLYQLASRWRPNGRSATTDWASSPRGLAEALRQGRCPRDSTFDGFLRQELQEVSEQYWTPLRVAVRAARWLDEHHVGSVLDVGSGAGKFCVAAALAGNAHFMGVEQRPRLVSAAQELASLFEIEDRVAFVHGTFGEVPLPRAEAYYLYNPFEENLYGRDSHLDAEIDLGPDRFDRDTTAVEQLLDDAKAGTYLLTYNGFGGRVPSSYRELRVDRDLPSVLCLWRKV